MVGYLPQRPWALLEHVVGDAIYYTARLRGLSRKTARIEQERLLETFGIESLSRKRFEALSGGEARLCALAVALVGHPPLLILDEPTNDLAPEKRTILWHILSDWKRWGGTVFLVSHNLLEVEQNVDRVILMHQGRIQRAEHLQTLQAQSTAWRVIRFRALGVPLPETAVNRLLQEKELYHMHRKGSQLCVMCPTPKVEEVVQALSIHGGEIEIAPPSLEDLYLEMLTNHDAVY